MSSVRCFECGASYDAAGDSCSVRFEALLALDHSRQEPWGSRHGRAFAAFALQHPKTYASSVDRAWTVLHRIYVSGEEPAGVFAALIVSRGAVPANWVTPPRPMRMLAAPAVTIADLADFAPTSYPERLDAWCRAALAAWGAPAMAAAIPRAGGEP